nr:MAG TPA: hypothetical protein [Caudoviricetes sp.]
MRFIFRIAEFLLFFQSVRLFPRLYHSVTEESDMKIITSKVFAAQEAARRASATEPTKKYSTLKIIRALGDEWENYRKQLEEAGVTDQFFAANYLAGNDPVFVAFLATVPEAVREKLENCEWEPE